VAAQQLEPEKTALLLTATAALVGHKEIAVVWLSAALGQFVPGVPLSAAKRLLWREAVNGSFGPAGLAEIETRLRACHPENAELYAALKAEPESNGPFEASRKLIALRALCEAPIETAGPTALGDLVRQLVDEGYRRGEAFPAPGGRVAGDHRGPAGGPAVSIGASHRARSAISFLDASNGPLDSGSAFSAAYNSAFSGWQARRRVFDFRQSSGPERPVDRLAPQQPFSRRRAVHLERIDPERRKARPRRFPCAPRAPPSPSAEALSSPARAVARPRCPPAHRRCLR